MKTEDLQDHLWAFVRVHGYKAHYCPRQLVSQLVTDLASRHDHDDPPGTGDVEEISGTNRGGCDLPGMCMTDRPWETIRIDTFSLEFPSQDFEVMLERLERCGERIFPDGSRYYKLHGWRQCVIFTPEQYSLVVTAMREMLPAAIEHAEKADQEFSRRIEELNEKGPLPVMSRRDKYSQYAPTVIPTPKKDSN